MLKPALVFCAEPARIPLRTIATAVALAFCALLPAGCSSGSPTTPSGPQISGASIAASHTTALLSATEVRFSLQGVGAPSYECSWEFGDGSVASGPSVAHIYDREGTFEVVARVTAQGSGATARATVSVKGLGGAWRGEPDQFLVSFTQAGAEIGGTFRWNGFPEGSASGRASHPSNLVVLFHRPGQFQLEFAGAANAAVDAITGTYKLCRDGGGGCTEPMAVTFRRQ